MEHPLTCSKYMLNFTQKLILKGSYGCIKHVVQVLAYYKCSEDFYIIPKVLL